MPDKITFARPTLTAAVSVTGPSCGLNCAHCGAKYLKGMRPPEEALAAFPSCRPSSVLVSGGSDPYGRVPVDGWTGKIKATAPGTKVNCHTGILDEARAAELAGSVDVVSYDYVSDKRVVSEVYGSLSSPEDYVESFVIASRNFPTVPHITVGLLGPSEEPALSLRSLAEIKGLADEGRIPKPPAIVVIVFRPTPGTRMESVKPPAVDSVLEVLRAAKATFPGSPVSLGCMRPAGRYRDELDSKAVEAGVDIIVMPSRKARKLALDMGLSIIEADECCVFSALEGGVRHGR